MNKKQIVVVGICIILGVGIWFPLQHIYKREELDSFSIYISQNEDFITLGLAGEGTESNPFILEDLSISDSISGIRITNVTKHCIIRNCDIMVEGIGIQILGVTDGGVTITNNRIRKGMDGIVLQDTEDVVVQNNFLENNEDMGVKLVTSNQNIIRNNTCTRSQYGIFLIESSNNTIYDNIIKENEKYGISINNGILFYSETNLIYENHFLSNYNGTSWKSQAFDEGKSNKWYNPSTLKGNYWSNLDSDEYEVDGYADATDPYPLKEEIRKVSSERTLILVAFFVMLAFIKLKRLRTKNN